MKLIKPSSPTPNHKRSIKLSLVDQLALPIHVELVLFYPAIINGEQRDHRVALTASLSKTLTHFYPYAGRLVENASIECADEGVVYGEAEVDCLISDVLLKRDPVTLKQFLPNVIGLDGLLTIPLLVQANFFKCGGFALGVLANHRVMDGVALSTFIRSWAAISSATDSVLELIPPDFTKPATLYPPSDLLNTIPERPDLIPTEDPVTKRYVFKGTSIAALKEKLGNETTQLPTRVEALSSLMWKCVMKASQSSSSPSVWEQLVNIRKRLEPPLSDNTPGNHVTSFAVRSSRVHDNEEIRGLLHLLKYGLRKFCDTHMKKLQDSVSSVRCSAIMDSHHEMSNARMENDVDLYVLTSWCGFKLYDANFGWGKPVWIGFPSFSVKNMIALMDAKEGDTIEAWITLTKDHMAAFEQDEDLLRFANGSIKGGGE